MNKNNSKLLYKIGYINNGVEVTKENQHEHVHPIDKSYYKLQEDLYIEMDGEINSRIIDLTNIDFSGLSIQLPTNNYKGYGFCINNPASEMKAEDCLILDFAGSDFSGCCFNDFLLCHCKFSGCNFSNAKTYKLELYHCDFDNAIFDNFRLYKRGMYSCILTNIDFRNCPMNDEYYTQFKDCKFSGSNFSDKAMDLFFFDDCDFSNTDMTNIKIRQSMRKLSIGGMTMYCPIEGNPKVDNPEHPEIEKSNFYDKNTVGLPEELKEYFIYKKY